MKEEQVLQFPRTPIYVPKSQLSFLSKIIEQFFFITSLNLSTYAHAYIFLSPCNSYTTSRYRHDASVLVG